ncbi:hypothetical protein ESCO_005470 [Escovopsis weberi]|uniref:Pre-mRNA-splicing factor SPF27 n=1 Tax=Escovopsis weberi TaxID=150374 RepID=A0A0M8MW17_ESCWE|nr:hypothetical protein ESCO_005470 [Escovopsis weberi]
MAQPAYHESLPYIDPEPSPDAIAAARALIAAEQAALPAPSLPPLRDPSFSPLIATELARIASKSESETNPESSQSKSEPQSSRSDALDLTRYEAQDALPPRPAPLRAPLQTAAVSSAYLASRAQHLNLLERHGRNAWLLGNYHLDAHLRALEADLAAARRDVDLVNAARARAQGDVRAEMDGLADAWRIGVGRVLETEIAVEEVRARIRDELRAAAAGAPAGA